MKGINFIKDSRGNLQEIRLDVKKQPQLAENIQRLIAIHRRHHHLGTDTEAELWSKADPKQETFQSMIREAKMSGEISENAFFQLHPEWKREPNES